MQGASRIASIKRLSSSIVVFAAAALSGAEASLSTSSSTSPQSPSTSSRRSPPPSSPIIHATSWSAAVRNRNFMSSSPPPSSSSTEASALRELKETVRRQAAEIDRLRKSIEAAAAGTTTKAAEPPSAHGAHGAAGSSDDTDLIDSYVTTPFYSLARRRVGWLSFFLCSLSLTAVIMNGFEHTLSKQIELAYFVPLLAGHGGNTGGQTVGTVLSALTRGVVDGRRRSDAWRVVTKEACSGLTVGVVLACIIGPVSHYLGGISAHVSTVVFCTLPLLSAIASTLASAIPILCVNLGLDPAVISAPAMTTFVDVTGLLSYFLIANKVFKLFGLEL